MTEENNNNRLADILGLGADNGDGGDAGEEIEAKRRGSLPMRGYPKLPDGSRYIPTFPDNPYIDEKEAVKIATRILENLNKVFKLGEEHSHLIETLLNTQILISILSHSSDPAVMAQRRQWQQHAVEISATLGLIEKNKPQNDPAFYVEELRDRAAELIADHGYEKMAACPNCGTMIMVYLGLEHPFLQDKRYAIWSAEVREMMEKKCTCGAPKLTLEEAAYILRLPPVGWSQIIQEHDRGENEPTIVPEQDDTMDAYEERLGKLIGDESVVDDIIEKEAEELK